jgi:hypothetical protein
MKNDRSDDQFDDLKRFIDSRISHSEVYMKALLRDEISGLRTELKTDLSALRTEIWDGFAGVAEVIELSNDRHDQDHAVMDKRLTKVEKKIAV